mgnify:CR=1 FL=1
MRTSKITARLLSVVLAVMMLFSLVTVGFTSASAAEVETAETGASIPAGTYLYLKPNSYWTQSNARFAIYLFGNGDAWVSMTKVAGETNLYEGTVPAGYTGIIFCRMNPSATANNWNNKWNQTSDLTWNGTNNCYTVANNTWDKGGGTWSTYTPYVAATTPATPAAPTVTVNGTLGGAGTEAEPYLVAPGATTNLIIAGALNGASGLAYGVNTTTKTDIAVGGTSALATVTAPALDETAAVAVNLWAYNKASNVAYSANYATTTVYLKGYEQAVDPELPDEPVVDNTFTLPYQVKDGLYAYAGTEVAGTNAWQRWDEVSGTRYFYLPASASDTEVVILNTYATTVLVNGVMIPANEYATVPYVEGEAIVCGGATGQTLKVLKSDAEAALYINSADGMETKNDDGVKTKNLTATYDVYAFLTSGSKNQEASKLAGAVADANGVDEEETTVKKIKGRGNSTWNLAKKPFNITYDENVVVDGMKGKKWSLLANAQDSSLLRNRLVYDLAWAVNMKYACDSRFVDWFVNGDYKGSYQLTQKIEMGKNTVMSDLNEPLVEVEEEGDVVPTENFDFILELDTVANASNAGDLYFVTSRGQTMTHKTPDAPTDEQVAFMKAKYQAVEDALYGNDMATLATLVDINDFARAYLVNEVAKNLDSGVTSCYFVYDSDNEIFFMSPVWDYDNALGNSVSIADRHDKNGNALDLTRPDGWYAKELMHYDTNFKGKTSVFAQAYAMTTKTADGKSFDDIVREVWAADFADKAAVLAGEAEAERGRLDSAEGYLANLTKSGQWNYSYGGWTFSANNGWISNHSTLTMYTYNAEDNTVTAETKKYDENKFADQAAYATDWMISRINWMSAQYNAAETVVPDGYITIYFENNWKWPDAKIHYWGGTTASGTDWPGVSMTYVDTTETGYDRFSIVVPADIEGIVFNGTGEYGAEQCADIKTGIADGNCYYMTYDSATNTKPAVAYKYEPLVKPTEPAATDAPATEAPATQAPATDAPVVEPEYITVYFSNAWMWTDVTVYFWGSAFEATPAWPGNAMEKIETNSFGQDIYKATIPADATGMLFAGKDNGADTKSPDITDIKAGYGYYMDWNEKDGTFVGMYEYKAPVAPSTPDEPVVTEPAATEPVATEPVATEPAATETPDVPDMPTVVTVSVINSAKWDKVAAYVWDTNPAVNWPGTLMEATGEKVNGYDVYALSFASNYTNIIFNNNGNGSQTANLVVEDGKIYDIKAAKWYDSLEDVPGVDPLASDIYLAGTFNNWSATANEFKLTEAGSAISVVTLDLEAATTYEFKVVRNGQWTAPKTATTITESVAGIVFSSSGQDNVKLTTTEAGTYTFTWNDSKLAVTYPGQVTPEPATPDEPVVDTTVKIAGSFTDWGKTEMTADADGKVYTISGIRLEKGTYEFKIVEFGTWMGNNGTIENTADGWTFKSGDEAGNCKLTTKGGVYTFIFDTETDKLTVTAELDKIQYAVTWNEGNFTVNAPASIDEATDLTFTIDAAEGFKVAAVIADMKILTAVDGVYTIANVQGNINLLVITSEVVTEPTVMEFTVTFTDKDGNVLDTQVVEYGAAATAPEAPVVEGYNFNGWDTEFDYVTKDITVKATYKYIVKPAAPATTGSLKVEVSGGTSFTIAVNDGAARPQGASYNNTKLAIGATVTLTAFASDDAQFLGWFNATNGMIVSDQLTYTFVAGGNDFFKAVYATKVEGVQLVTFMHDKVGTYGRVLDSQYYASTDAITFPDAPSAPGYDFTGWNMTEADIQAAIAAGQDVTVKPVWEKQMVYVNVTVVNGTGGGKVLAGNGLTVTANAAPAGQKFAYWVDENGTVKSYTTSYKFYPTMDTTVTAVYVAEDEVVEETILVTVDYVDVSSEARNVTWFSWYVPANITVTKVGILGVNKDNYTDDALFVGTSNTNVYDRGPSKATNSGTASWGKGSVTVGQTWITKAYVMYLDENGATQIAYSDEFTFTRETP